MDHSQVGFTPAANRLVRKERLELSRVAPLEPKSSASTNSATFAKSLSIQASYHEKNYPGKFVSHLADCLAK